MGAAEFRLHKPTPCYLAPLAGHVSSEGSLSAGDDTLNDFIERHTGFDHLKDNHALKSLLDARHVLVEWLAVAKLKRRRTASMLKGRLKMKPNLQDSGGWQKRKSKN